MRVLCLHGYAQTAAQFEAHFKRVAAACPQAEFVYLEAPHVVPSAMIPGREGRAWWRPSKNADGQWEFDGVDETLEVVRSRVASGPAIHAVMGFSQGAALASLLAGLHARAGRGSPVPELRRAAFAGGFAFAPARPEYHLFRAPLPLPSLHVSGAMDSVVSTRSSRRLAALFAGATLHVHPAGHAAHSGRGCASLDAYRRFFSEDSTALRSRR